MYLFKPNKEKRNGKCPGKCGPVESECAHICWRILRHIHTFRELERKSMKQK